MKRDKEKTSCAEKLNEMIESKSGRKDGRKELLKRQEQRKSGKGQRQDTAARQEQTDRQTATLKAARKQEAEE